MQPSAFACDKTILGGRVVLLNTIVNLPIIGGILNPVIPPRGQEPPQEPTPPPPVGNDPGDAAGDPGHGQVEDPAPQDPAQVGGEPGRIPSWAAGGAIVPETVDMGVEALDDDWARRAALAMQENERVSRMIEEMAAPKASEALALLRNDDSPRSDLRSVIAAYRENEASDEGRNAAA